MGAQVSRRAGVLGLAAVTLAAAVLYALGSAALWRQQRATVLARLQDDAGRIAREIEGRWADLRWGNETCRLDETTLMAVWRRDGVELCRSAYATHYRESVLARLLPAALERGEALQSWDDREQPYGTVPVLAWAVPVRRQGDAVAVVTVVASVTPPAIALAVLRWGLLASWLGACASVLLVEWRRRRRLAGALRGVVHALEGIPGSAAESPGPGPLLTRVPAEEAWRVRVQALAEAAAEGYADVRGRLEQREAVLASMREGVLALDPDGRLIDLNAAAAAMFGLDSDAARGRDLLEVVRHPDLQRFVREALASPEPVERELTVYEPEPRILQVRGTALRDGAGRGLGTLLVLHDVTRLRRLERLRQDFVANVSHELRTPITAIKGFVETLLDGAVDDPEDARRFLGIVARHAERLNAITEDLLSLSRVEQEAERGALHTEDTAPTALLEAAAALCAEDARARRIAVEVHGDPALHAPLNPQLVEQALVNLLSNAVKFAPEGSTVRLEAEARAEARGQALHLRVTDEGPGIPSEHLPRLFERFYRADKARTRDGRSPGGTGLGLAIVKHIAQAHGGRVEVSSRLGEGSTFTVVLPLERPGPQDADSSV